MVIRLWRRLRCFCVLVVLSNEIVLRLQRSDSRVIINRYSAGAYLSMRRWSGGQVNAATCRRKGSLSRMCLGIRRIMWRNRWSLGEVMLIRYWC